MTRISEQPGLDLLLMVLLHPIQFFAILFWRALGKKVRARGRLDAALLRLPFAKERSRQRDARSDLANIAEARAAGHRVDLCVHLHVEQGDEPNRVRRAISAIMGQSEAPVRVFVSFGQGARRTLPDRFEATRLAGAFSHRIEGLQAALVEAQTVGARWLVPCTPSHTLTPHALASYAAFLLAEPQATKAVLLYGDTSETGSASQRKRHWLKPRWDPRMILSQDYVTQGCALAVETTLAALSTRERRRAASLYELVLAIGADGLVQHVSRVVAEAPTGDWERADPARLKAAANLVAGRGCVSSGPFGTMQVQWRLPERLPTVSVIVATRDRVDLLRTCVEGVLEATDYPALDLIIADNESVEPETLSYLDRVSTDPRVQIVRWPQAFNYSAINNYAASFAKGEYLCLLNNDIEVIEPDWLGEMVREVLQPGTGAVGARLLYPDRSIQHAGVAIGIGNAAGHAHRALPEGQRGYFAQALVARGASAVTAACLVVKKAHFDEVGGLDEDHLAVAYNDVDFCLKLQALGLRNIYTPRATLIHHESKSRGLDFAPEHLERYMRELAVFQKRWDTTRVVDPWHHPALDRSSEVF